MIIRGVNVRSPEKPGEHLSLEPNTDLSKGITMRGHPSSFYAIYIVLDVETFSIYLTSAPV